MADAIQSLAEILLAQNATLATAESCTGGLVAKILTDLPGSSQWFERGFVTYSNQAKHDMLGVSLDIIERYGAVSGQTVAAMARGALANSRADYVLSVSGIAGPGGVTQNKPVGTVYFGLGSKNGVVISKKQIFSGDRAQIRQQSAEYVLSQMLGFIKAR